MARGNRSVRRAKQTILIVGEGDTDVAFINHIKTFYVTRYCGIALTTNNAHGKGPAHIIDHTVRQAKLGDYDLVVSFLDTDVEWTEEHIKTARDNNVHLIGSDPCIDCMLLKILGRRPPHCCKDCKKVLLPLLRNKPCDKRSHAAVFTKEMIEETKDEIPELKQLLDVFNGSKPAS